MGLSKRPSSQSAVEVEWPKPRSCAASRNQLLCCVSVQMPLSQASNQGQGCELLPCIPDAAYICTTERPETNSSSHYSVHLKARWAEFFGCWRQCLRPQPTVEASPTQSPEDSWLSQFIFLPLDPPGLCSCGHAASSASRLGLPGAQLTTHRQLWTCPENAACSLAPLSEYTCNSSSSKFVLSVFTRPPHRLLGFQVDSIEFAWRRCIVSAPKYGLQTEKLPT